MHFDNSRSRKTTATDSLAIFDLVALNREGERCAVRKIIISYYLISMSLIFEFN